MHVSETTRRAVKVCFVRPTPARSSAVAMAMSSHVLEWADIPLHALKPENSEIARKTK